MECRKNIYNCGLWAEKMQSWFCRKLYIADARPRKNALANGAMGGGSESSSNYFQSEVGKIEFSSCASPLRIVDFCNFLTSLYVLM